MSINPEQWLKGFEIIFRHPGRFMVFMCLFLLTVAIVDLCVGIDPDSIAIFPKFNNKANFYRVPPAMYSFVLFVWIIRYYRTDEGNQNSWLIVLLVGFVAVLAIASHFYFQEQEKFSKQFLISPRPFYGYVVHLGTNKRVSNVEVSIVGSSSNKQYKDTTKIDGSFSFKEIRDTVVCVRMVHLDGLYNTRVDEQMLDQTPKEVPYTLTSIENHDENYSILSTCFND